MFRLEGDRIISDDRFLLSRATDATGTGTRIHAADHLHPWYEQAAQERWVRENQAASETEERIQD